MFGQNHVSWQHYEGVEGFGASTAAEVEELNKALTAGSSQNPPGAVVAGDGFALRVESLERTLKNTTFKMEHLRFFRSIPKLAAYNTVEEHNEISSYGQNPDAGFVGEGDLPESDDSTYERKFATVKYLGTTRKVTHPMTMVKPAHGNVIAQETVNGTMHLLRILERAMFYGNSSLSSLQFDGIIKLLEDKAPSTNIIDLRGKPLSEDVLTDGALTVQDAPNYGTPTHLFLNPKVKADLVKTFFPKERYDLFSKTDSGMVGLDIRGFTSPAGDVKFEPNVFINDGGAPTAALGDSAKRPSTPSITTSVTTPADALSKFEADDAGDYIMKVQAVNRYGRSAAVAVDASAIAVVAGDKITFGVTPGAIAPDWWEVFRTKKNGLAGTERLVLRVANAAGSGATTINEYNNNIPGCTHGMLMQMNDECLAWKQLAPMLKIPLATIDIAIRWAQVIYGVLVLYTPGKNVLYKNIGRASGFVGAG